MFEQTGCEILLLPLFAQMANLHITLLRDGVQQKFCNESVVQSRILSYTKWVNQWTATANANASSQHARQFNPINQVVQFMQVKVSNFVQLWPYFDPVVYPQGVTNLPPSARRFFTPPLERPLWNGKSPRTASLRLEPWPAISPTSGSTPSSVTRQLHNAGRNQCHIFQR